MPPEPPTLAELRELPATLDYATTCRVLRISKSQGYKLIKAGTFPVAPLPHSGRNRLYALAGLFRYFGLDPAMVAVPVAPKADAA